jgi:hypothetical protein
MLVLASRHRRQGNTVGAYVLVGTPVLDSARE